MTRFVVRVDDVGQAREGDVLDPELRGFMEWWDKGGWGDEPIYLGVVPGILTQTEIRQLLDLEHFTKAEICIHGWDHHPHVLNEDDLYRATRVFPKARGVIPPYNKYDGNTLIASDRWLNNQKHPHVLFGGLPENKERERVADHPYGDRPVVVNGCLHLSAIWALYDRCYRLLSLVDSYPDPGYPVQMVLHWRWDVPQFLNGVAALRKALAGRMAAVEEFTLLGY